MTMLRLDLTDSAAADQDLDALREENRSLRDYLKRVLAMMERHAADREVLDQAERSALTSAEAAQRLAGLEDGLQRIEHDLQTVLWLVRGDRPAITSVD